MREMECIRQGLTKDQYLTQLLKEVELVPLFKTWDDSRFSSNGPLILVLDEDHVDALLDVCADRELKFVVALNTRKDFKLVSKLSNYFDKIFGFVDLSQEIEYNVPILKNYLNMNFSAYALRLEQLASDLDKVYEFTKNELVRVKDLHDRLVKVRVDTLKGVTVTSKFMAGEKSGGEFFDMLQTDQDFLFIQAGSNSYILSSLILAEMEILKMSTPTTSMKDQAEHFIKMVSHHAQENNAELNYCIINMNLKNLQVDCQFRGDGYLYYQNELIDFSKPIKLKLKPAEKFYLLSNGSLKNLKELNPKFSLSNFYSANSDKNTRDLINEFFFELSRNKTSNFLIYDALMSVIEIDQKMLYQI